MNINSQPESAQISSIRQTKNEPLIDNFQQKKEIFCQEREDKLRLQNKFELDSNNQEEYEDEGEQRNQGIMISHNFIQENRKKIISSLSRESCKSVGKKKKTFIQRRKTISHHLGFNITWKQSALRIIYFITKFLQILKTQTHKYKFKLMTRKIFQILNDKSGDFDYYYYNQLLREKPTKLEKAKYYLQNLIFKNKSQIQLKISIIQPDSLFKIFWDLLVLSVIIINIFYIPLKLSFDVKVDGSVLDLLFDQLPSYLFTFDIILKFNTAYYYEGDVYQKRKKIFQHYLKGDFIWDLIVVIPFLISKFNIPYMDFVLLLRITRISKMFENIEETTSIRDKFAAFLDLGKLIYINIFVSHFCACAWHYLGVIEGENNSWIYKQNLIGESAMTRYIHSFYWSTITTSTVGYGDISATTEAEMVFIVFMVLITSIVFGYTISSIGSIFAQMKEKNDKYKNSIAQMNSYIKKRIINPGLQMKVRKYFENFFKSEQKEECEHFMELLSNDLKKEVQEDLYIKLIQGCPILEENFSQEFLQDLCQMVKTKKYIPGQVVFQTNEITNKLYFILSGELKIYFEGNQKKKNSSVLRSYKPGYVLNAKNFIMCKETDYAATTSKFTEIAYLEWEDFMEMLQNHQRDMESYSLIKDNLFYNPYFKKVIEVCPICISNHNFKQCPFTFFLPNKLKLGSEGRKKKNDLNVRKIQQRREKDQSVKIIQLKQNIKYKKIDRESFVEQALLASINNNFLNEQDLDELFLNKVGIVSQNSQIEQIDSQLSQNFTKKNSFGYENQESSYSGLRVIDDPTNLQKRVSQVQSIPLKSSTKLFVPPRTSNPSLTRIGVVARRGQKKETQLLGRRVSFNPNVEQFVNQKSSEVSDDESQLDIIHMDYLNKIKEEQIPNFEKNQSYQYYYNTSNLDVILNKINKDLKQSQIIIKKDLKKEFKRDFKTKSNIQAKLRLQKSDQ